MVFEFQLPDWAHLVHDSTRDRAGALRDACLAQIMLRGVGAGWVVDRAHGIVSPGSGLALADRRAGGLLPRRVCTNGYQHGLASI